jgi:glycosyltransferase involved in cell wall biosynthesis
MKIAIDISPLETGHKVRGVGFYLQYLKSSLLEHFPQHEYLFFTHRNELKGEIDVVHYPYFDPFFITLPLIKKYPTVVTVHDLTPLVFPDHFPAGLKGKLRWQIQKQNLRNTDMLITDSEASKQDIIKIVGVADTDVRVTYLAAGREFRKLNAADIDHDALRRKYHLPKKFILYVGDVTWNKNLPNLIRATTKAGVTLVMIGKSLMQTDYDKINPWNKDLVEVQKLCETDTNILRLGFVPTDDLVGLYNIASLFIMPSHYEGFGLPIIEAMQSGCPVITTRNGSLPEVAGDAAVFVDGNNIEAIADGITKVFKNESLQKELSKKGLDRAKKFSWRSTAEETMHVYESIMKNNQN